MIILSVAFILLLIAQALLATRHSHTWQLESAVSVGFAAIVLASAPSWDLIETAVRVYVAVATGPLVERLILTRGKSKPPAAPSTPTLWGAMAACAAMGAVVAGVRF